jgi:hypothetical protein
MPALFFVTLVVGESGGAANPPLVGEMPGRAEGA